MQMNTVRELPVSATEAEQLSWLRETEPVVFRGARMRACPIQLEHLNRHNIIECENATCSPYQNPLSQAAYD